MDPGVDTIVALSTAPGRAAIAVLRLSGPQAGPALERLIGRLPPPRRASLRRLHEPLTGETLDEALVLWLPGPDSYTGENMAEIQGHGGRAVIEAVLGALLSQPGVRPAEPGEFSRRAFQHGRMDLTAAEATLDLVEAETAEQRRQALNQGAGRLAALYDGWRERLIRALAYLEADIDFPDEDLPGELRESGRAIVEDLIGEMAAHLDDDGRGERLREGISVAILGAPNVGKSSLLNALARRDAAIVSSVAGTTRDVVEVHLDLGGYPVILADTAGLREAPEGEGIEAEGIRRARERAARADLKLAVFDASAPADGATLEMVDGTTIVVLNKSDLCPDGEPHPSLPPGIKLSVRLAQGLEALQGALTQHVVDRWSVREAPVITRARHRQAVAEAVAALERSRSAGLPELAAEDVRLAARALGRVTGRVDVEELLDVIFREFCIGK